jgi:hypothetical protein
MRLGGLGKLKKSTSSGSRTGDLPACSIVPKPTTLPRAPVVVVSVLLLLLLLLLLLVVVVVVVVVCFGGLFYDAVSSWTTYTNNRMTPKVTRKNKK